MNTQLKIILRNIYLNFLYIYIILNIPFISHILQCIVVIYFISCCSSLLFWLSLTLYIHHCCLLSLCFALVPRRLTSILLPCPLTQLECGSVNGKHWEDVKGRQRLRLHHHGYQHPLTAGYISSGIPLHIATLSRFQWCVHHLFIYEYLFVDTRVL